MKLIDKDALIEKLWERRVKNCDFGGSPYSEYGHEDDEILSLINTLEVKEVDIEKEMDSYFNTMQVLEHENIFETTFQKIAKHFFELGMLVSNKAQKEQMMKNTADAMIGLPYENKDGGYTHLIDVSRPLPVGNNKIAIIFKED